MNKGFSVSGKVDPTLALEQAKVTGKNRYMGRFLEKQFKLIDENMDQINNRILKLNKDMKSNNQEMSNNCDEIQLMANVNGKKIKKLQDDLSEFEKNSKEHIENLESSLGERIDGKISEIQTTIADIQTKSNEMEERQNHMVT